MKLSSIDDCKKLEKTIVKYVNVDIKKPSIEVIKYLLDTDYEYLIGDYIDSKYGYVYVSIDKYKNGQNIINNIIAGLMNKDYNELEIAKYLYVNLALVVGLDINVMVNKSDIYNFSMISNINNIWESISLGKVNNVSITKLYLYLCSLVGIECDLVSNSDSGYLVNKLTINNKSLIVDITKDIAFIQAGYKTRYFDNYNDDQELDKRIGYLKNNYSDNLMDIVMKKIDYSLKSFVYNILTLSGDIIGVDNFGPQEMALIYEDLFEKYCSGYNIMVNNLYINNELEREHFVLISYNNLHYSYNYNKKCFVEISNKNLLENLNSNKIGFYLDEEYVINSYDTLEDMG